MYSSSTESKRIIGERMKLSYSKKSDFLISVIIIVPIFIISYLAGITITISNSSLAVILTILTTILGVLLTVIAILYTFETSLKRNKGIRLLIARDKYDEIFERFTDSIMGIFYAFIVLLLLFLLQIELYQNVFIPFIYNLTITILVIFSIIRTYRCFNVFKLLQDVVKKYEK